MRELERPEFSAVLLAGGLSTRMGCDKATLNFLGVPLWLHQIATLRAVRPTELFISGREQGPYSQNYLGVGEPGIRVVMDPAPGLGPLAGIATALRSAHCHSVLILAVDLPAMSPHFLSALVLNSQGDGLVPQDPDGFEPLAAVYTKKCLPLAESLLISGSLSLQFFVRRAVALGLIRVQKLQPSERGLFLNLNRPADLLRAHVDPL